MKPSISAGRARGLVNAILRRALREKEALEAALDAADRPTRTSHPEFLIERWMANFRRRSDARTLHLEQQPADVHVRANWPESHRRRAAAQPPPRPQPSPCHPLRDQGPPSARRPGSPTASATCRIRARSSPAICSRPQPGETRARCLRGAGRQDELSRGADAERRPDRRLRSLRHRASRACAKISQRLGVDNAQAARARLHASRPAARARAASIASSSMRRAATPASSGAASMCAGG